MTAIGDGGVLRKRPTVCERIEGFNPFGRVNPNLYESNRYSFYLLVPLLLVLALGYSGFLLYRLLTETVTTTQLEALASGCADLGSFALVPGVAGFPAGLTIAAHGAATRAGNPDLAGGAAQFAPTADSPPTQVCRGAGDYVELSAQVAFDGVFSGWGDQFCFDEEDLGLGHVFSSVPGLVVEHALTTVRLRDMKILSRREVSLGVQQSNFACRQGYAYFTPVTSVGPLNISRLGLGGGSVVTAALGCEAGGGFPLPKQRMAFDESGNVYVTCYTSASLPELVRLSGVAMEVTGRVSLGAAGLAFAAGSRLVFAGPDEAVVHLKDGLDQELLQRIALADMQLTAAPVQVSALEQLATMPESELTLVASDGQGHAYLSLGSLAAFAPVRIIRLAMNGSSAPHVASFSLPAASGTLKDGVMDGSGHLFLLTGHHATAMHVFSVHLANMEVVGDLALDSPWLEDAGEGGLFVDPAANALHLFAGSHTRSHQWVMTLPLSFGPDTSMASSSFWRGRLARSGGLAVNAEAFPPHVSSLQTLALRKVLDVKGVEVLSLDPSAPNLQTGPCLPGSVCLRFSLAELQVFEATRTVLTWQEWLGAVGGFWGLAMSSLGQVNNPLQDLWNRQHPPHVAPITEP